MLFHYSVEFFPEDLDLFKEELNNRGYVVEKGLIASNDYGSAANRLVDWFGSQNIISMTIYECENPLCYDELRDMIMCHEG